MMSSEFLSRPFMQKAHLPRREVSFFALLLIYLQYTRKNGVCQWGEGWRVQGCGAVHHNVKAPRFLNMTSRMAKPLPLGKGPPEGRGIGRQMHWQKDSIDGTDYGKRKQFSLICSQQMPDADRHLTYVVCLRSYRELPAHPSPYPPCPLSDGKGIRYEKADFLTQLSFHDLRASPISFAAKPPPSFLIPHS